MAEIRILSLAFVETGSSVYIEAAAGQSSPVSPANTGTLLYNTILQKWQFSQNGSAYVALGDVGSSRTLTAGAGLTGGGDLSTDRTFNIVANADGSITVNANDIQIGVLATDAQHGLRSGGTQHAIATTSVAGFLSAADKTILDGLSAGSVPASRNLTAGAGLTGGGDLSADRTFNVVANADGSVTVNANDIQVGILASDSQHGIRGGGTQHAVVVAAGAAGFMSGADKSKLDQIPASITDGAVLVWGNNSILGSTTTRFLTPGYADGSALTSAAQFRSPIACTAKNMRIRHNTPAGNGNTVVYTLRVNSVASALTVSMASTSADGSDLVNSVAIAAGDLIDIRVTKAASIGSSPSEIVAAIVFAGP